MLTKLKRRVQELLAAEARVAHQLGLSPNHVSVIGALLAFSSALAYTQWQTSKLYLLLATVLLLLSGFCDALDGVIARLYQQTSSFGGFLDSLLDRYADATVYMGIIFSGLCSPFWGVVALTSSLLVSYTRARAEALQIKMENVGLAERPERMIILSIASVAAFFYRPEVDINVGIIVIAVLATFTVLQRSFYTYRKLEKK